MKRARPRLQDVAVSTSLANVFLLPVWARIFGMDPGQGTGTLRPALAAIITLLIVTALFTALSILKRRHPKSMMAAAFRWFALVVVLTALNGFRVHQLPPEAGIIALSERYGPVLVTLVGVFGISIVVAVLVRWTETVHRAVFSVALLLVPLIPMTIASAAYRVSRSITTTPDVRGFARTPLTIAAPAVRVVWIVFDEMDQNVTFDARPAGLTLPALDRLRDESFAATKAVSPSNADTIVSIPALVSGRPVYSAEHAGWDDLLITFSPGDIRVAWSGHDSVFSRARRSGFESALIGWYLPYCRSLAPSLTRCTWTITGNGFDNLDLSLFGIVVQQLRLAVATVPLANRIVPPVPQDSIRRSHIRAYLETVEAARTAATDERIGLTMVHFPIPHRPFVYDRARGELTTADGRTYFDNLVLADRAFGELRAAMEAAGTWTKTSVLVSADHSWRMPTGGVASVDPRVPFVLKLAGHQEKLEYHKPLNTIVTHDLLLALLHREIHTARDVTNWLDRRAARTN